MNYVYIQSENPNPDNNYHSLYTVGFYGPDNKWEPESDYSDREQAARRVHYLNGGDKFQASVAASHLNR
jgi:hypothetical protein